MDIEHIDGTFTSLDIISVNPSAQPFVHCGNTRPALFDSTETNDGSGIAIAIAITGNFMSKCRVTQHGL